MIKKKLDVKYKAMLFVSMTCYLVQVQSLVMTITMRQNENP
jgi:hypothetical protein